ncbi:DcrB-related protein [Paraburkholderia caribensis]|uniref:DcrB-related protein n=1 Tax=Paraburkholderia caribensis TaxID=75105 RepID=UPI001D087DCF|nr:DcrB-related protein [Paraburkholderia caribensis]
MYQIQEGQIDLPREWQDKTMNVFVSAGTGTEGVSFVITRERMPWGMKFDEYADGEVTKLARQARDYVAIQTEKVSLSGRPAFVHEYTWTNNQAQIQQCITMVELGETVLMLTFTAPGRISDTQRRQLQIILTSLQLHDRISAGKA